MPSGISFMIRVRCCDREAPSYRRMTGRRMPEMVDRRTLVLYGVPGALRAVRYGMIVVTRNIVLDEREIEEQFIRASGPGGQNVNKVSSAVQLRFSIDASPNLNEGVRRRLKD